VNPACLRPLRRLGGRGFTSRWRMSNYIPWCGKKQAQVTRRKAHLRRLIRQGASEKNLEAAAQEVRLAQIRALRARQARLIPREDAVQDRGRDPTLRSDVVGGHHLRLARRLTVFPTHGRLSRSRRAWSRISSSWALSASSSPSVSSLAATARSRALWSAWRVG
jgi:hypothetical protein